MQRRVAMKSSFQKEERSGISVLQKFVKDPRGRMICCAAAVVILVALFLIGLLPGKGGNFNSITTAEEAISYLQSLGTENGYRNALADLTELHTIQVEGNRYFRFQQNYQGVPVFGRTVICVTDSQGQPFTVNQNVWDIPEDLDVNPSVTFQQVEESILAYLNALCPDEDLSTSLEFSPESAVLYIYNLEVPACLVYEVYAGQWRFLVNAHTAEVEHCTTITRLASATFQSSGETINAGRAENGQYILKDENTQTYVFTAQNSNYLDVSNGTITRNRNNAVLITSQDAVFGNDDDNVTKESMVTAENMLNRVNHIRKFYDELQPGILDRMILICDDAMGTSNGENACGATLLAWQAVGSMLFDQSWYHYLERVSCVSVGTVYSSDPLQYADVIAHEYTHCITRKLVDWIDGTGETGALDEAFSDIFGELYEGELRGGAPDWLMAVKKTDGTVEYVTRNLRDPKSNRPYPLKNDKGYPVSINENYDQTDPHIGSTIISHIAYKLAQGDPQNPTSAIPLDELKDLWFGTLLGLNANANFLSCRWSILESAELLFLSDAQKQWIEKCFDDAGIRCDSTTSGNIMTVFGLDGNPYENYTVTASMQYKDDNLAKLDELVTVPMELPKDGASFELPLSGLWRVTISDLGVSGRVKHLFVDVCIPTGDQLPETIPIYTDFVQLSKKPDHTGEYIDEIDATGEAIVRIVRWDRSARVLGGVSTNNFFYEYIELQGGSPAYRKINETLFAIAKEVMDKGYDGEDLVSMAESHYAFSRVIYNCNGILCIRIFMQDAALVGVNRNHISYTEQYVCFNLSTGESLTLSDLTEVDEGKHLSEIRRIAWEGLSATFGDSLLEGVEERVCNMPLDEFRFAIQDGEVVLYFPPKEVSSDTSSSYLFSVIPTGIYVSGCKNK